MCFCTAIDKTNGNVAFICEQIYALFLIKELLLNQNAITKKLIIKVSLITFFTSNFF